MRNGVNRRDFLKRSAFVIAAYASSLDMLAAGREGLQRTGAHRKVIVIGAGLAGMAAAYELMQAGHDVMSPCKGR